MIRLSNQAIIIITFAVIIPITVITPLFCSSEVKTGEVKMDANKMRIVRIKVLADRGFRESHKDWIAYATGIVKAASEVYEKLAKVRLEVNDIAPIDSRGDSLDLGRAIQECDTRQLDYRDEIGDADLVIAFRKYNTDRYNTGFQHIILGNSNNVYRSVVVAELKDSSKEIITQVMLHEIGHMFCMVHTCGVPSFMQTTSTANFILTLDEENRNILLITKGYPIHDGIEYVNDAEKCRLVETYKTMITAHPGNIDAMDKLVQIDYSSVEWALTKVQKAAASNPDDTEVKAMLAFLELRNGDLAESEKHARDVLKVMPNHAHMYDVLGEGLGRQGRFSESEETLKKAASLGPSYMIYYNLGVAQINQDKTTYAVDSWRKCVEMKPDFVNGHLNLSKGLAQSGDFAGAWREVKLCRKYGGTVPDDFLEQLSKLMPEP